MTYNNQNDLAPICLFVYNRPDHLRQTLYSLKENVLSMRSMLYIFSDGPKNQLDKGTVGVVRKLIRNDQWCGQVEIIESPVNKGLADSIIDGVTAVINKHGRTIVLEDDLILAKGFLKYMNDALRIYANENRVMHISGYMFPVKKELPDTFFLNIASCWGWGTWQRSWKHFEKDSHVLLGKIMHSGKIKQFNLGGAYDWLHDLRANAAGEIKTWAIRWYASFFLQAGYCLHPGKTLVRNIGLDGSGVNCGRFEIFSTQALTDYIPVKKVNITELKVARRTVKRFFLKQNYPNIFTRLIILIKNLF